MWSVDPLYLNHLWCLLKMQNLDPVSREIWIQEMMEMHTAVAETQ